MHLYTYIYIYINFTQDASNTRFYRTIYVVAIDAAYVATYVTTYSGLISIELLSSSSKNIWGKPPVTAIYILRLKYDTSSLNFKDLIKPTHVAATFMTTM